MNIKELGSTEESSMENADNVKRGKGEDDIQHPNFIDSGAHFRKSSKVCPSGAIHSRENHF